MMKRIQRYIVLLLGVFVVAISLFLLVGDMLLRELIPGVESWQIELILVAIDIGLFLTGIIIAIYGYIRWRKPPSTELAQWYRQFKGRREMARCPRCGSLKIDFEEPSPVPSPDSGKINWKAVCYDCGKTWEIEK